MEQNVRSIESVNSIYINTKMYVCLSQFESDWDTVWHKVVFWSRECSNTNNILIGCTPCTLLVAYYTL